MGHRGFCRLRPVHLAGMIKRYRQIRAHISYLRKHGINAENDIGQLESASDALAAVIISIDPTIALKITRIIAYQPERPLPRAALNRAIFAALRSLHSGVCSDDLFRKIWGPQTFNFPSPFESDHFKARFAATLNRLVSAGSIQFDGKVYSLRPR